MSKIKTPIYKKRQKLLKKLGVINHKITKTPSSKKEQQEIARKWAKYSEVATAPEKFTKRVLGKANVKLFKSLGYAVKNSTVYINNEGYHTIKVRSRQINGKNTTVVKKIKADKYEENLIIPKNKILEYLEGYENKRLPAGEFITVKIGNHSQFSSRFKSTKDLMKYLENQFSPQQPLNKKYRRNKKEQEKLKQELIDQMSIVKFTI